jgi:hypothetical protein
MHWFPLASVLANARADDNSANHQVVANLRESVTAISAQLGVIAETLQHLPAETREHELLMNTLLQLRDEHDTLKRRLQDSSNQKSTRKLEHFWQVFFVTDAILGAALYEQQIRGDLRGEALWIRRIVTGTCTAVFVVLLQTLCSLISGKYSAVMGLFNTCLVTIRVLLLAAAVLNDLMRLPKALQEVRGNPPQPPGTRTASLDKARERTARKLESAIR